MKKGILSVTLVFLCLMMSMGTAYIDQDIQTAQLWMLKAILWMVLYTAQSRKEGK